MSYQWKKKNIYKKKFARTKTLNYIFVRRDIVREAKTIFPVSLDQGLNVSPRINKCVAEGQM